MKRISKKRWVGIGMFAALATVVTLALMLGPFGYTSVCDRCGALRSTTEWQVPMTQLTMFRSSTESESPLSRVLLTNGIVGAHSHRWLFAQGGGNGVKCAIGKGRHIRFAAGSDFAALVLALHERGEIAFRDRALRGALDPRTGDLFRGLIFTAPKGEMSAAEFREWIARESADLDVMVAAWAQRGF